jgi:hypothetical protein
MRPDVAFNAQVDHPHVAASDFVPATNIAARTGLQAGIHKPKVYRMVQFNMAFFLQLVNRVISLQRYLIRTGKLQRNLIFCTHTQ